MALLSIADASVVCAIALALGARCGPPTCDAVGRSQPTGPPRGFGPRLEVDLEGVGGLATGASVTSGDLIQLSYRAAGHRYGVIVSLDGAGVVTLHHPARPGDVPRIRPRTLTPLDHAFELDDAPGFERFFFVTAAHPLRAEVVLEAASALGAIGLVAGRALPLPLPGDLTQTSFLLRKSP